MNTKLLGTIGAIVALGLGAQASATTVDLGEIAANTSAGDSLFYSTPATSIDDTWTFTLTETLNTAIIIDSADLAPFFGIADLTATSSSGAITFVYDAGDNSYSFSGELAAGAYDFNVTGTTNGKLGGEYEVIVGAQPVAPVPVPAGLWLLSSAMLFVLRRPTKKS
jgi:hypothetical protein